MGVSQKKTHDLESSSAFCESLRSFYDLNQTAVISPPHLGRDNQLLVVCSMCKTDPQGIHLEYVLTKAPPPPPPHPISLPPRGETPQPNH